jgi:ATP-dependent Clp protease ATP-binding subunit ClpA
MGEKDMSISEQFFRTVNQSQNLFVEREREFEHEQRFLEARLKEKEDEIEELTDALNGKNCEIHELKKEVQKWKEIADKKSESDRQQPSTTDGDNHVPFTGFPTDISTVSMILVLSSRCCLLLVANESIQWLSF